MLPKLSFSRFWRSSLFRISAAYTLALTLCLVALGAVWWVSIRQTFISQFQHAVESETMLLVDVNNRYGHEALKTAIENQRLSQRQLAYGLFAPDGKRLLGKLTYPHKVKDGWAFYRFEDPSDNESYSWRATMTKLPDGNLLVVGGSYEVQHELLEKLVTHLLLFVGAMFVLVVGGSAFLSRLLSRRIRLFNQAIRQIAQGDLSQRVPVSDRGDEFDQLSAQVNEMLASIQKLTENLQQVSTDIAHDIRTPLGHLYKHLEAALADPKASKKHIEKAMGDARRMLDIFTAMLRLAEIESGSVRAMFKDVDASALVAETCDAYLPSFQEQGHRLATNIAPGLRLTGDGPLLRQMLANLLENGLTHTPEGTAHKVVLAQEDGRVVLTLTDNGPGIPAEERRNVLKRFYRLSKSRSVAGSGLGLATVNAVAELHGAQIELFEAAPGLGVRIAFA